MGHSEAIFLDVDVSPEVRHVLVDVPVVHDVHDGLLDPDLHVGYVDHHAGMGVDRTLRCNLHCGAQNGGYWRI